MPDCTAKINNLLDQYKQALLRRRPSILLRYSTDTLATDDFETEVFANNTLAPDV